MDNQFCCQKDFSNFLENGDHIAQMVMVALTLALIVIAWVQIEIGNKIKRADFLHRLKVDFFTEQMMNMDKVFKSESVKLIPNINSQTNTNFWLFEYVNNGNTLAYHSTEVSNLILNNLEDAATYWEQGQISLKEVKDGFGSYIKFYVDHPIIMQYINEVRATDPSMDFHGAILKIRKEL